MKFTLSFGQELQDHTWKNRLLILTTKNPDNPTYKKQVSELLTHLEGLEERKLLVYHVFPNKVIKGFQGTQSNRLTVPLLNRFNPQGSPFSISLIGLDGGIKLQKNQLLLCKDLFGLIDGMPMRKAEIRNKSQKKGRL